MNLFDAQGMREADRRAIEDLKIPGPVLMENAARGAVAVLLDALGDEAHQGVTVIAGKGNNGGDGHVLARYLHGFGFPVQLVLLFGAADAKGDAALNLGIARRCGVPITEVLSEAAWARCRESFLDTGVIVDAIFGTGLTSELRGLYRAVVEDLCEAQAPIFAMDVPTGVDASTGQVHGIAASAAHTATFGGMKLGLTVTPGCDHAGDISVVDIGIPPALIEDLPVGALLDAELVAEVLPPRHSDAHKGTFGHLLVIAGGMGKLGAAILTAQAALRSGTGLVTLAVPRHALNVPMPIPIEVMVEAIPDDELGCFVHGSTARLRQVIEGKSAIAFGPGIGTLMDSASILDTVYDAGLPLVMDADALNLLAGEDLGILDKKEIVLTPHPGEMARLIGCTTADVQSNRLDSVRRLAQLSGVVSVLKGAHTLIADPLDGLRVNPTGNPGMATAGAGDVLTGLIGGLMAQGVSPVDAASAGVWLHGRAGDLAADVCGGEALIATDIIAHLGTAFSHARGVTQ